MSDPSTGSGIDASGSGIDASGVDAPGPGDGATGSGGRRGLRSQLVRFVAVGALSAVVDYSILVLLMHFGLGHTAAKACSFVAGTTTAYLLNRRWTFGSTSSHRTFIAVLVLYGTTFAVQVGLFSVLYPWVEAEAGLRVAQVVAFVIAQGVATTVNFIVQRVVIFRHRDDSSVGSRP